MNTEKPLSLALTLIAVIGFTVATGGIVGIDDEQRGG